MCKHLLSQLLASFSPQASLLSSQVATQDVLEVTSGDVVPPSLDFFLSSDGVVSLGSEHSSLPLSSSFLDSS